MKAWIAAAALAFSTTAASQGVKPEVELWRLDCGTAIIKDFNTFFSDTLELRPGPREIVDSCYLIRHGDQYLLWDTGFGVPKGQKLDIGPLVASNSTSVVEQLAQIKLKPSDIDVVGISHSHFDHTGQAAQFPAARLVVGRGDFEEVVGKDDPFVPWRGDGAKLTKATADVDIFGDGSVVAVHTPGHTANHLTLMVRLASGPLLLSGDLYHSAEARAKKAVPPFNINRAETLASMDRYERLAKSQGARIIIQHEPADVAKLPAFPKSAR